MIRNFELRLSPENNILIVDPMNRDFTSLTYFILLKIKAIKIPKCSYIKIQVFKSDKTENCTFEHKNGVLYVSCIYNFTDYLNLKLEDRFANQYKIFYDILIQVFKEYEIPFAPLEELKEFFKTNRKEVLIERISKKVSKGVRFKVIIILRMDCYIFLGELHKNDEVTQIEIFKSLPYSLALTLFSAFKVEGDSIKIGTRGFPVFEIDLNTMTSKEISDHKVVNTLRYRTLFQ